MNKLTNVKIDNNELTFTVDTDIDIRGYSMEVYIDETDNLQNVMKDSPVHSISIDKRIIVDSDNNVTVINTDEILPLDWNMKYITLKCFDDQNQIFFHGIYYNPEVIYSAEIRKLHSYCSTCLDDHTMQNMVLVVFKRLLLEYAIESGRYKDALQLYVDICRLLEISTGKDKCAHTEKWRNSTTITNCDCNSCSTTNDCCTNCCNNGCCKL